MRKVSSPGKVLKVLIVYVCQEVSFQKIELGQINQTSDNTHKRFFETYEVVACAFFLKFPFSSLKGFSCIQEETNFA